MAVPPPRARIRSTSSSPRSAARSATSSRCRSSRRPARCATTSAATTCFFLHVSLVPYLAPSGELKTKPTQHSVPRCAASASRPTRSSAARDRPIPASVKRKIALMCDVDAEAVVSAPDAPSIYEIPKVLHAEGLDAYVVRRLGLPFRDVDWTEWGELLDRVHQPEPRGDGRAGRQVRRPARRLPVGDRGAARRPVAANDAQVDIRWVPSDDCEDPRTRRGPLDGRRRRGGPGRLRRPRHRGQARRGPLRPREPDPRARAVPRPAVHGDRVGPAPGRHRATPTRPSSIPTRPTR